MPSLGLKNGAFNIERFFALTHRTGEVYANQRIIITEVSLFVKTFGQIIAEARKALGLSQKDLAAKTRKEDGEPISPQYLNDIEHDRRDPPSNFIIEDLAKNLKLSKEHLMAAAGLWPPDLRDKLAGADPKKIEEAFTAFRKALKSKP
jgi:transcriptional regulator with XRE-family HTH domain